MHDVRTTTRTSPAAVFHGLHTDQGPGKSLYVLSDENRSSHGVSVCSTHASAAVRQSKRLRRHHGTSWDGEQAIALYRRQPVPAPCVSANGAVYIVRTNSPVSQAPAACLCRRPSAGSHSYISALETRLAGAVAISSRAWPLRWTGGVDRGHSSTTRFTGRESRCASFTLCSTTNRLVSRMIASW